MDKEELSKCANCNLLSGQTTENGNGIRKITPGLSSGMPEACIADAITYFYGMSQDRYPLSKLSPVAEVSPEFCERCTRLLEEKYLAHLNFENASNPKSFVEKLKRFRIRPPMLTSQKIVVEDENETVEDAHQLFKGRINMRCANCHLSTKILKVLTCFEEYQLLVIYGISWEDFLLSFYETSVSARVEFCIDCSRLLQENHKAHMKFEILTHAESFVGKANKFQSQSKMTEIGNYERPNQRKKKPTLRIRNLNPETTSTVESNCLPKEQDFGNIRPMSTRSVNRLGKKPQDQQAVNGHIIQNDIQDIRSKRKKIFDNSLLIAPRESKKLRDGMDDRIMGRFP